MRVAKKLSFFVQIILSLSLVFAVLYFNKISISSIGEVLGNLEVRNILLFIIPILILDRILMSYKWGILLRSASIKISLWENIKLYMASGFVGMLLPSTIGADLIRSYQLSRSSYSAHDVMASVVIERILGFVSVEIFALITASILYFYSPANLDLVLAVFLVMGVISATFLVVTNSAVINVLLTSVPRCLNSRINGILSRFMSAFSVYRDNPRVIYMFVLLTLVETLVPILLSIIFSYDMGLKIDWFVLFLIVPLVLIIIRLPVTINGIGVIEGAYVMILGRFGVDNVDAFSLGAVMDAAGILMNLMGGLFVFPLLMKKKYSA